MNKEEARQFADNIGGFEAVCSLLSAKDKSHAYRLGRYDGYLAGAESGYNKAVEELKAKKEQVDIMTGFCAACKKLHEDKLARAGELLRMYVDLHYKPVKAESELRSEAEKFLKELYIK